MGSILNRLDRRERHVLFYDSRRGPGVIDMLGHPDPTARSPETIEESALVQIAVGNHGIRRALAETLGLDGPLWMLVGEQRSRVFPDDPDDKPGDFDIIVGHLRDGRPWLDRVGLVEVKRSRVRADGSAKSPSGLGTTQARGGAQLGFDAVLLVHFVIGSDESIRSPSDKAALPEHDRAVRAVASNVRSADRRWAQRPYGLLIIEWARGRGARLERTGALAFTLAARPRVHKVDEERRERLVSHLRSVLPDGHCPETLFLCDRCGAVGCDGACAAGAGDP